MPFLPFSIKVVKITCSSPELSCWTCPAEPAHTGWPYKAAPTCSSQQVAQANISAPTNSLPFKRSEPYMQGWQASCSDQPAGLRANFTHPFNNEGPATKEGTCSPDRRYPWRHLALGTRYCNTGLKGTLHKDFFKDQKHSWHTYYIEINTVLTQSDKTK